MASEISRRQAVAQEFMKRNGYSGMVMTTAQNIQYFTGITEPSIQTCGVVIMAPQAKPILAVIWVDKDAALAEVKEASVEAYSPTGQGKVVIETLQKLGGAGGPVAMDIRATTILGGSFRRTLPGVEVVNATFAIEEQIRSVKSEEEIQLIRKTCEITQAGMKAAADSLKHGISELEVAAIAEHKMITLGSDTVRHAIGVASGYRARLVHAFATQKKIAAGEMVTIDLGATYQGYTADLARTFFLGKPDDDLVNAYSALRAAQDAALEKIRPGVTIDELQAVPREVAKAAGYPTVGHMGHNIGLAIEEHPYLMGAATPDPNARIEKNNVLAFFQGSVKREGVMNLGIRLEDTVLVTGSGAEILTNYPREIFAI